MKRVLVVSPHFPPLNAADMQRVRMLLPFFAENGWQAEVLTVMPDQVDMPQDAWLLEGVPEDIPVHRVRILDLAWSRIPGLGSLAFRARHALAKTGDRILAGKKFDLIYFSTTVFPLHVLGPRWKKKFGIPFVMDYQDPWVNDYYREHPEITPPGGRLKFSVMERLHRRMEPRVLRHCAGITSVSEAYPKQIAKRYPGMPMPPVLVQAFPGASRDFKRLSAIAPDKADGKLHWLYVGRGGADMATALRALFMAIRDYADEALRSRLQLDFIGTSYAAAGKGKKTVTPLAAEFGLENMVFESTDRIAYSETLQRLRQADALIVPGSDDPAYTASKIYPYLLARKPLLAIFHRSSSVVALIQRVGGAVCVSYSSEDSAAKTAVRISEAWLAGEKYDKTLAIESEAFDEFSDSRFARELTEFFQHCLTG